MKNLSSLFIIFLSLYLFGCKDSSTIVQGSGNRTYPAQINNEWEYQTVFTVNYYNQSGTLDSTVDQTSDNGIIKILKTNDSLSTYKSLIKYESYSKLSPLEISYDWYLNSDTSFLAIAYYNPGAGFIQPKRNPGKTHLTTEDIKKIIYSFSPDINRFQRTTLDDSIQYYPIPRKVLAYPLNINKTWVELYHPFYRERYVNNYLNISANGESYLCYEIKTHWPEFNMEFNDYISLDAGLVKREIIADSVQITTIDNPDGSGQFVKQSIITTLVKKNFLLSNYKIY